MKKVRTLAVALAAVAGMTASFATSAMADNVYAADGTGTKGGTPTKPKPAKLSAVFTTGTTLGDTFQPKPVKQFKINIEGGRLNKKALLALKACKPSPEGTDQTNSQCSKKSIIGGGTLDTIVGSPGSVMNPALKCSLPFNTYNVGGGKLGLFIDANPPACPIQVQQWIIIKTTQVGLTVTTTLDVPDNLTLIVKPDTYATVLKSTFYFNPIMVGVKVKVKGKTKTVKQSVTESIGCAGRKTRNVSIGFTDIDGGKATATKKVPC